MVLWIFYIAMARLFFTTFINFAVRVTLLAYYYRGTMRHVARNYKRCLIPISQEVDTKL